MQLVARTAPATGVGATGSLQPALVHQIRMRSPRGDIVVELEGQEPPWLEPALDELNQLLQLPPNLNSYNAMPIEPLVVVRTIELLDAVMEDSTPFPQFVPTP